MPYLLDTNIVSDLLRNPKGRIRARISEVGEAEVFTSIIVVAEARYGIAKKGSARLQAQLEAVLGSLETLPFDAPADYAYAKLRVEIESAGTPIGANDMMIAAHAIALGYTLVTANEREFVRVPGLAVENWLR